MDSDNDKITYTTGALYFVGVVLVVIAFLLFDIAKSLRLVYDDTHWMTGVMEQTNEKVEFIYNILEDAN